MPRTKPNRMRENTATMRASDRRPKAGAPCLESAVAANSRRRLRPGTELRVDGMGWDGGDRVLTGGRVDPPRPELAAQLGWGDSGRAGGDIGWDERGLVLRQGQLSGTRAVAVGDGPPVGGDRISGRVGEALMRRQAVIVAARS